MSSRFAPTRAVLALAVVAILVSGCQLVNLGRPKGGSYPGACADLGFNARRCAAIVARAHTEAPLGTAQVGTVDILPPAGDDTVRRGGLMVAEVRFNFGDGSSLTQEVWCKGVWLSDDLACEENPELEVFTGIDHDVPCTGEAANGDPAGCATPPPTPPPAAVAAASPLHVPALDIPLDHLGRYEIKVGQSGLPNGYLTKRQFVVPDTRPTDFWIRGGIYLDLRPPIGRPPVGNVYRDPFKGTEPVDVFLVFEVTETSPGAVLKVRNLVVE